MSVPRPDKRIGRHRLTRSLPSSDVLSTYEAVHDDAGPVHLRVLEAEFTPSERALSQLASDAALASSVHLEGATTLVDWSADEPIHASTTVILGKRVADVVATVPEGRLGPELVAALGADLARTLAEAHDAGLIHGGLSPKNVYVTPEGRALVTDYAIARFLTSLLGDHSYVLSGMVRSLAPEQLSAPDTIGSATDVFALGVLLYRACTGAEPFEAPSAFGMSLRLTSAAAEPIGSHGVELPAALAETIMAMLSASMVDRPTLDEVRGRLAEVAGPSADRRRELSRAVAAAGGPAPEPIEPRPAPAFEEPAPTPEPVFAAFHEGDEGPTRIDMSLGDVEAHVDSLDGAAPLDALDAGSSHDDRHPTRVDIPSIADTDFDPTAPYIGMSAAADAGFESVPATVVLRNFEPPGGHATRPTAPMNAPIPDEPAPPAPPPSEPMGPLLIGAWIAIALVIGLIAAIGIYAAVVT